MAGLGTSQALGVRACTIRRVAESPSTAAACATLCEGEEREEPLNPFCTGAAQAPCRQGHGPAEAVNACKDANSSYVGAFAAKPGTAARASAGTLRSGVSRRGPQCLEDCQGCWERLQGPKTTQDSRQGRTSEASASTKVCTATSDAKASDRYCVDESIALESRLCGFVSEIHL